MLFQQVVVAAEQLTAI